MSLSRPSWVEIDLAAVVHNVELTRKIVGESVKIYAVCKADAMGCGLIPIARTYVKCGVDALAVSDPNDVVILRNAGLKLPILLFASTLPEQAAEVSLLDVVPVIHDIPSLNAFAALKKDLNIFLKIDSGMGRLGLIEQQWETVFKKLKNTPSLKLTGLYTHMSKPEDCSVTLRQNKIFQKACCHAELHGFSGFERIAASSRITIDYPELHYTAVDVGRMLLGMLGPPWSDKLPMKPAIRAVKSRIIQVQDHPPGTNLGIGYGSPIVSKNLLRTAVIPIGFSDGLNHAPPLGEVLIFGQRVPVLGRRSIEFSLLDISSIKGAKVGAEVVILGIQGDAEITPIELADTLGIPMIELLPRIAHNLNRQYFS